MEMILHLRSSAMARDFLFFRSKLTMLSKFSRDVLYKKKQRKSW